MLLRCLDVEGRELYAERRLSGRQLEPEAVPGAHTVEISALLQPETTGTWTFGMGGFGRMTLTVDGRAVLDGTYPCETDDPAIVHVTPPLHTARAHLERTRPVLLVARRELASGTGRATVVAAAPPARDSAAALAEAVDAARGADAVIVFVGTTEYSETEGYDRTDLSLGRPQDDLVRAVAAANPRTVAVVNSGGPVELPWRSEVGALLLAWFPGQEAGAGLADILFGRSEPGGRLPTTWAASLADAPVTRTRPVDGRLATRRACTSGTARGSAQHANPPTGSGTVWATPPGPTSTWKHRHGSRSELRSPSGSDCATPEGVPDVRSSRCTWLDRNRAWSARPDGSSAMRRSTPTRTGR